MPLQAIYRVAEAGAAPASLAEALLVTGRGLAGDRYAEGRGHWSKWPDRSGIALTIIDADQLEGLYVETGLDLRAGKHRRNLETRGVDLRALMGKRFRIGEAFLEGVRPCAPCQYLEYMAASKGAKAALANYGGGGLRCEVLEGGLIRVGDAVTPA